jgi:hypothetical protein
MRGVGEREIRNERMNQPKKEMRERERDMRRVGEREEEKKN